MANDTEQKLSQEQSLQEVKGQVGTVPVDTRQQMYNDGSGSARAQNVLSAEAKNLDSPAAQAQAKQVLNEVQHKENPEKKSSWPGIALFFGIGLLSVFALKKWADAKIGGPDQSPA